MTEEPKLPTRDNILAVLRPHRTALLMVGLVQGLLGAAAVAVPQIATEIGIWLFGLLLALAGLVQLVQAVRIKGWKGTIVLIFTGLVDIVLAVALFAFTHRGAVALTLVLALLLLLQGVIRLASAVGSHLPSGRVWFILSGLASVALGALLWWEWPADAVWAIGLLLGINLLMGALAVVGLAASLGEDNADRSGST